MTEDLKSASDLTLIQPLGSGSVRSPYRLIVFTRYPEAGRTKTRLIPALGAAGAAVLQKRMTEHLLRNLQRLQESGFGLDVEVRFAGGDRPLMQQWLGPEWNCVPQGEGDLGDRLKRAFETAFEQGGRQVVAIGIDCPDVDETVVKTAFEQLKTAPVVLGPAVDGGYYLVGLTRFLPQLFEGIDWSTDRVLQQTLTAAQQLEMTVAQIQTLGDVDRPEDLQVWQQAASRRSPADSHASPRLSIIIPTVNEEASLPALLAQVVDVPEVEVIVADGGSQDATPAIAQYFESAFGVKLVTAAMGRAAQMNAGAAQASGNTMLFLHADTQLPTGFADLIQQTLAQPDVVAGAFNLRIQGESPGLRLIERGVSWRSHLMQLPYGDQGLFLKREMFESLGGFALLPIMEDFELVQRLKQRGRVAIAPAAVVTSGRRWASLGLFKTTLINQIILIGYGCGIQPQRLARWYRHHR